MYIKIQKLQGFFLSHFHNHIKVLLLIHIKKEKEFYKQTIYKDRIRDIYSKFLFVFVISFF